MDGVLGFFGNIFKAIAGFLAIVILVLGFFIGGKIGGGFGSFSIGVALLGLLLAFVFDVIVFGFIGMVAEVNARMDSLSSRIDSISSDVSSLVYNSSSSNSSSSSSNYGNSYQSSDMLDRLADPNAGSTQFWTCKKCGCSSNPQSSTTCKDCGEYK